MPRFPLALALLALLAVTAAAPRVQAQSTPFPYADGVEDTTAAKGVWAPSGTAGARFYTSTAGVNARTGTRAWRVSGGGTITLRNPVSLVGKRNPHFAVWTKAVWEGTGTGNCGAMGECGDVRLEVSLDGGTRWDAVAPTNPGGPTDGAARGGFVPPPSQRAFPVWKRMQWPLDAFAGTSVLLRLTYGGGPVAGYTMALDDVLVDEAPIRLEARITQATNNRLTVSWPASSTPDFSRYRVVVSTSPDYAGAGFATHEYRVMGVQYPYAVDVRAGRLQRRVRDVTVQGQTSVTIDSLVLAGTTYFARVYEVDTQGFTNQGSETAQMNTTLDYGPAVRAPFAETFDAGTTPAGWLLEPTWAVSNEASAEPGHSAPGVLSDSPGGNYAPMTIQYATVRVDFSGVKRPVLRFKHRYALFPGAPNAPGEMDGGTVQWSKNGQTWVRVAAFAGTTDWKTEELDLSELGEAPEGYLRFLLADGVVDNNTATTVRDGWKIDDVEVTENARVSAFPFRDDVEGATPAWVQGGGARAVVTAAHSGTSVWRLPGYPIVGDRYDPGASHTTSWLTLAGAIDLRSVPNPVLSLWIRNGGVGVQVSLDGGRTWIHRGDYRGSNTTWVQHKVSLEGFQSSNVLIRFGRGVYPDLPEIDDIEITGSAPGAMTSGTVEFRISRMNYGPTLMPGDVLGVRGVEAPLSTGTTFPLTDPDGDGTWTGRVPFTLPFGTALRYQYVVLRGGSESDLGDCSQSSAPGPPPPSIPPNWPIATYTGSMLIRSGWHSGYCQGTITPGEGVTSLTLSGGGAPGPVVLTTGFHPQSTTGLDELYGERELPPTPPEGTFTARFVSGDGVNLGQGSVVDLRPGTADFNGTLTHYLTLQRATGAGAFTFAYELPNRVRARLRDGLTGSIFSQPFAGRGSFTIPNTGNLASVTRFVLDVTYGETCVDAAPLAAGWNMISVPVAAADMAPATLFPGTASHFAYTPSGYASASTFTPGVGYWAKAEGAFTASPRHCGAPVAAYDVPLRAGWNMIGGFEFTGETSRLVGTPTDVVSSSFFGYANGYATATSLVPGRGYWVRAKSDGTLRVVPSGAAHPGDVIASRSVASAEAAEGVLLVVEDAAGRRTTLRLVTSPDGRAVLPPLPPSGLFDARFLEANEGSSEGNASGTTLALHGATYPVTVTASGLAAGQSIRLSDALGRPVSTLAAGERLTLTAGERFSVAATGVDLPTEVSLAPAHPNPSRGTATRLGYALPESGRVRLAVFDVLGREVARLVEGEMPAGSHAAVLESGALPSGLYVVRMEAQGRTLTRTLVVNR